MSSEKSKTELKISDKPLKPGANVDYDPKKGLIVETGYRQEGKPGLIDRERINITADGNYAKIDNTFFPVSDKKELRLLYLKGYRILIENPFPQANHFRYCYSFF